MVLVIGEFSERCERGREKLTETESRRGTEGAYEGGMAIE